MWHIYMHTSYYDVCIYKAFIYISKYAALEYCVQKRVWFYGPAHRTPNILTTSLGKTSQRDVHIRIYTSTYIYGCISMHMCVCVFDFRIGFNS